MVRGHTGYKTISPVQFGNLLDAYDSGGISFGAVRVWFAAVELVAIREAAARVRAKTVRSRTVRSHFDEAELMELTRCRSRRMLRANLRELDRARLLRFQRNSVSVTETAQEAASGRIERLAGGRSKTRPIPVPRAQIRFLARCGKPALLKTLVGYYLRGLSIDRKTGALRARGTVKVSWLSDVMEVSERAVKASRAELIGRGVVSRDVGSYQRKLNRDGAYFELAVGWGSWGSESAPHADQSDTDCAPPKERPRTPNGVKDQKARRTEPAGLQGKARIRNVRPGDLKRISRVEELYRQAVRGGLVRAGEAGALNVLGAAVRARDVECEDPCRVFVGIVKRGLWQHITGCQEDRARRALARYRESCPSGFREQSERQHYQDEAAPRRRIARASGGQEVRTLVRDSLGMAV